MSPPHNQLTGPSFLPRPTKGPQPRESGRQLCKLLTEGETHNVVVSHKEKEERGGSKWRLVKNEIKKGLQQMEMCFSTQVFRNVFFVFALLLYGFENVLYLFQERFNLMILKN